MSPGGGDERWAELFRTADMSEVEAAFHFGRQLWPKSGHRFLT